MNTIRITKRFTFEMAHALLGYDGLCKNIHGHSYILWVTLKGTPINDINNVKNGMLMDFSELSTLIKTHIVHKFDHALLLNQSTPAQDLKLISPAFERLYLTNYQPTCENLLVDFAQQITSLLPAQVKLYSLKLQETETSFAEWFADDNK